VFFRGREITHQDIGKEVLDKVASDLSYIANVEQEGAMEGRMMAMLLGPKK
jgi:translation initiation factor IF-3